MYLYMYMYIFIYLFIYITIVFNTTPIELYELLIVVEMAMLDIIQFDK